MYKRVAIDGPSVAEVLGDIGYDGGMTNEKERFSLKDQLFNDAKVRQIASEILKVFPNFRDEVFVSQILSKFPELELLERIYCIRDALHEQLDMPYREAVSLLIESLPPESDPTKSDDDFGDFIYAPYSYFIAEYGCTSDDLQFSLDALKQFTTRFSAEGPIRYFLDAFPKETISVLKQWSADDHYHVRRLASEGTRPLLPWAKRLQMPYDDAIPILDVLYSDSTRFVTRSVANHVNDISKISPETALMLLERWRSSESQTDKEMLYITQHALRTLVKDGNGQALAMLGYGGNDVEVDSFFINTTTVVLGDSLEFSFQITSTSNESQRLMIDYKLHLRKANDSLKPKTFKIAKKSIKGNETLVIEKKHRLANMSTRKLYPGEHVVELQINGVSKGMKSFELVE